MKNNLIGSIVLATSLVSTIVGCNSDSGSAVAPAPLGPVTKLYIAGGNSFSVHIYDSAETVDGNVAPDREIVGASTNISRSHGIAYDSRSDSLFVGNWGGSNNVVIYDAVSSTTGNVPPSRELVGASTGLNSAHGVFLDEVNDRLYVSGVHGVAVFDNASTVDGNVAPGRLITGANTLLNLNGGERRSFVDTLNDRLYVLDPDAPQVLVFNNASTVDGNVAPDRVITSASFIFPWGMTVDVERDLLYMSDQVNASVMVFANASTADGTIAPTRTIAGAATTIAGPANLFVDAVHDTIYVADADGNQILIWNNASTLDGNVAPDRAIVGAATGLNYPGSVVGVR